MLNRQEPMVCSWSIDSKNCLLDMTFAPASQLHKRPSPWFLNLRESLLEALSPGATRHWDRGGEDRAGVHPGVVRHQRRPRPLPRLQRGHARLRCYALVTVELLKPLDISNYCLCWWHYEEGTKRQELNKLNIYISYEILNVFLV